MADDDKKVEETAPPKDKPEDKAPEASAGQAKDEGEALPEKFKGKSAGQIAKSYSELEEKLGKNSKEVKEYRDQIAQWAALGNVIKGNPDLKKAVEAEIDRLNNSKSEKSETKETAPAVTPERVALEDQIIGSFESERGLKSLATDKKKELNEKIGNELQDMLDPMGTKTRAEVLRSIPVNRLSYYLDKAYRLATIGDTEERARSAAFAEARENAEATFGSFPSSGGTRGGIELTASEKETAKNMGISEKDYKEQKIAILKGE